MNKSYIIYFQGVLKAIGHDAAAIHTPAYFMHTWNDFVTSCMGEYKGSIFDFDNGIILRTTIHEIMGDISLTAFPEFDNFCSHISITDQRFRLLVQDGRPGEFWWERALLLNAGQLYKEQVKLYYGFGY
ncbi:hypothetical protein [Chitinophaga sp. Cy-1792]|uniref:hypothetical protein n=1 Tax=Chitinophaga sp. Cy-1792 TaxID=2608339 RepID=UPI0014226F71|nr:hypothetical protein [Chitinophaga sp. Cy-1792]NIG54914.1 hypothetical protein [Chitinophaga sp. Cy-1792]